ncbi:hypothetical protein SAMN05428961_11366 [Paenibacillus sp. OK060]|nr:hypothetical protein SAMN05428961_11366 [Paenibacillus sp. OK060]
MMSQEKMSITSVIKTIKDISRFKGLEKGG